MIILQDMEYSEFPVSMLIYYEYDLLDSFDKETRNVPNYVSN